MNKTAVEWLFENIKRLNQHENQEEWNKLFEQAKSIEKEQILDSFDIGFALGYDYGFYNNEPKFFEAEQYYNETYERKPNL